MAGIGPGIRSATLLLSALAIALAGSPANAQPTAKATIAGGSDESGQRYRWTVTNHHAAPVIRVEFPHYMADLFTVPEGWHGELTDPLGKTGRSGLFIASSADPTRGIAQGRSAAFDLKIGPAGTPRGKGDVLVRFADDTEILVRAEVPVQEPAGDRHIALIGLGLIFGAFVLIRAFRRGGTHRSDDQPPASTPNPNPT
jgi:hypothetical protein